MDLRAVLVWVHILLFVFWLGADLGVFIAAVWVRNPALGIAERAILLRVSAAIDLAPRVAFVLMMPVGLTLAQEFGLPIGNAGLFALWLLALVWLALVLTLSRTHGGRLGHLLGRIQFGFLLIAGAAFVAWGIALLTGGTVPGWLAWKIVLYGGIFFLAVGIDFAFRPVAPAFGRLAAEGSTPDVERAIRRPMDRALAIVATLYLLLLVISFLGTVKPEIAP